VAELLFDRFVDLSLYHKGDTVATLVTPLTGRKPDIHISGSILPSPVIASMNIRLVNFYSPVPLSYYTGITINAGYRSSSIAKNSIKGALNDMSVGWAYQETPGPDGITNFTFMLGDYDSWTGSWVNVSFSAGTYLNLVFSTICSQAQGVMSPSDAMALNGNYAPVTVHNVTTLQPSLGPGIAGMKLPSSFQYNGPMKDALSSIIGMFEGLGYKMTMMVVGTQLRIFFPTTGWQPNGPNGQPTPKVVSYLSSPPKVEAGKISFVAPWRPDIVPGDVIALDPIFAKTTFGGSITTTIAQGPNSGMALFTVLNEEFDFSTVGDTNTMRVEALFYKAPKASS
jgi:hypothetical protein